MTPSRHTPGEPRSTVLLAALTWLAIAQVMVAQDLRPPVPTEPTRAPAVRAPQSGAEPHPDPDLETSLEDADLLAFDPLEIVFTASRFEQSTAEAPASVTIVTAEQIERYRYRTLTEILASVAGFYARDDRNYESVGVRGFGREGDYNNRILVLLDGHRVNDNIFESGATGRDFVLDVDLIERVEIVRGPSSSLYGSNGFFGVVNVITKAAGSGSELSLAGGSRETIEARVTLAEQIDELGLMLSATGFDTRGEKHVYYPEFDDPSTRDGVARDLDGEVARSAFGKLEWRDFSFAAGYVERERELPTGSFGTVFADPRGETEDSRLFASVGFDQTADDGSGWNGRLFYDRYIYTGIYVYDEGSPSVQDLVATRDTALGERVGTELQRHWTLAERHHVTVGAEYRYNLRTEQANISATSSNLDDRRESWLVGVYAQDEFKFAPRWLLNAGLRFDYYSTFHGTLNPRVALVHELDDATTVKALYGRAFRAASAFELYYNDAGLSQKANPDLDPEVVQTYELAVDHRFGAGVRGAVSLFQYDVDDLITQVTDPLDSLLVFRNLDSVRARGVETELGWALHDRWNLRLNYAYSDVVNRSTEQRLSNSPLHVAKLFVDGQLNEHWTASLELQYVGARKTPLGAIADDYTILNLNLLARELVPGTSLSLAIKNVFDVEFDQVPGEEHTQTVLRDQGRAIWMQFDVRF